MSARRKVKSGPTRLGLSMGEISEATLQIHILQYLAWRGIPAWPTHSSRNHPETPGMADIVGVLPEGRFLAIECKAKDGRPTPAQVAWLESVNDAGGLALIARDIETVQQVVDATRRSV